MRIGGIGLGALLFLLFVAQSIFADESVRVRLLHEPNAVEISGVGLLISGAMSFLPAKMSFHTVKIARAADGLWQVQAGHGKTVQIQSERLWVQGEHIRMGKVAAPSSFEIVNGVPAGLDVVAPLDLQKYLVGVLPAEMPVSWPLEALKAQAVAARSYVLREAAERQDQEFDVDASILDQVYRYETGRSERVSQAVRETHDQILIDTQARALKAFYSADCGCQSEDPKYVWGDTGDFTSVKDPTCERRRPARWQVHLSRGEVRQKLIEALNLDAGAVVRGLHIEERTPSGRVARLVADLEEAGSKRTLILSGQEFRRIFGFQRVASANFSTKWDARGELEITGIGLGHGVGLCQRGARSLAQDGLTYQDILKTYYPRARIKSI